MALTDKQRRFVDEYLVDLNATQAAIRAGYSEKTAYSIGNENLSKPDIAEAIQEAQAERSKRTEITQDMVLRELAKIGFSDIRRVVRWGKTELRVADSGDDGGEVTEPYHGLALVSADDIDDDTAAAISEISEGREGLKVKLHDKKGALVDIGRHLGMFKDRVEHSGPNGGPIPTTPTVIELVAPSVESKG
ncbi:terminase [Achromobacter insolitus]|uniref:terminase small subunit n=1 Tax=Achromobacter insolitus TaxID=217204 RepID=UPI0007C65B72|nr:terminase small subunit [Achromobacter insolitus]OAE52868.1 terminase [Achromobacter insolitus]OCZ50647.1 terminase [Achromobacter insolitus]